MAIMMRGLMRRDRLVKRRNESNFEPSWCGELCLIISARLFQHYLWLIIRAFSIRYHKSSLPSSVCCVFKNELFITSFIPALIFIWLVII